MLAFAIQALNKVTNLLDVRCCCNGAASLLCERSHEQSAVSSDYPIIHDRCAKQVATLRKACIRVSEQFAFVMFPLLLCPGFIFETISRRCVSSVLRLSNSLYKIFHLCEVLFFFSALVFESNRVEYIDSYFVQRPTISNVKQ